MKAIRLRHHLVWIFMTACCFVAAAANLFGKQTAYESGLLLEKVGFGHVSMAVTLFILIGFLGAIIAAPLVIYQIFALRSLPKGYLLTLLALPASWFITSLIPIPSFEDGLAVTLKKSRFLGELTESAAKELKRPLIENDWERKRGSQLIEDHPFSLLKNCDPPRVSISKETLILDFGGSLSRRWGLAISGLRGTPPHLPSYALAPIKLNNETWMYSAID